MSLDQISVVSFQDVKDDRGRLTAIEGDVHIPFSIKRIFYVHQVVPGIDRGGHAHRDTDQVISGIHGSLKVDVSDGASVKTYVLDDPGKGIYVPGMLWIRLYDFSDGTVCLVLANTIYDKSRSLRTWKEYMDVLQLPWMNEPGSASTGSEDMIDE